MAYPKEKIYEDGSVGTYCCLCYSCKKEFIGHKRDFICPDCADRAPRKDF